MIVLHLTGIADLNGYAMQTVFHTLKTGRLTVQRVSVITTAERQQTVRTNALQSCVINEQQIIKTRSSLQQHVIKTIATRELVPFWVSHLVTFGFALTSRALTDDGKTASHPFFLPNEAHHGDPRS